MSEWITDRMPTEQDSDQSGVVWVTTDDGKVNRQWWATVSKQPWMPIVQPEPYVKPKSWHIESKGDDMYLCHPLRGCMHLMNMVTSSWNHMQAAIRIAAIYEEVMP